MDDWRIVASADDDHNTGDYDVGEAFGEHDIEYWIYDGKRLVPASPDEAERLRELEAWPRLTRWQEKQRPRARLLALRGWWTRVGAWRALERRRVGAGESAHAGHELTSHSDRGR